MGATLSLDEQRNRTRMLRSLADSWESALPGVRKIVYRSCAGRLPRKVLLFEGAVLVSEHAGNTDDDALAQALQAIVSSASDAFAPVPAVLSYIDVEVGGHG